MMESIKQYSRLFTTVEDKLSNDGGRTILRATDWQKRKFFNFAVEWDEDHDERVIWLAETIVLELGFVFLEIGEHKGIATLYADPERPITDAEQRIIEEICGDVGGDLWSTDFCELTQRRGSGLLGYGIVHLRTDALWSSSWGPPMTDDSDVEVHECPW